MRMCFQFTFKNISISSNLQGGCSTKVDLANEKLLHMKVLFLALGLLEGHSAGV